MSGECLENRTFDEINVGDSESFTRTLTSQDLYLFAAVSGDVNPTHVDNLYVQHFLSGKLVGHSLWSGALISGVLGTQLPGPGTVYEPQNLQFLRPLRVGDTVTATVMAREKRPDGRAIVFDRRCVNIGRELGSLAAVLGGLAALVFTAGIGEHSAEIRARVCGGANWLGVTLDDEANQRGGPRISKGGCSPSAWVIPTDEELMIARHTFRLICGSTVTKAES